jgi:uncharacterized Fe-S center protein
MHQTAEVYFRALPDNASPQAMAAAAGAVFAAAGGLDRIADRDLVAVKLHVGEKGNDTFVGPEVFRALADLILKKGGQPFMTETSTLYRGERENAVKHALHAHRHGFTIEATGMPFLSADGLAGTTETEVPIPGILNTSVKIAREILMADALVAVAHMTGHLGSGYGGVIKTLGMGLASRMGKMRQHSSIHPQVDTAACTACLKCIQWCPEGAITEQAGHAFIDAEKCIGCGECVAVCRFEAVRYNWGAESDTMEMQMAEHALGVVQNKAGKCIYINAAVNMTKDCDCMGFRQTKIIPDLGFFASLDPVAVDQACQDQIRQQHGKDLGQLAYPQLSGDVQLKHGEKIGLGTRTYALRTL